MVGTRALRVVLALALAGLTAGGCTVASIDLAIEDAGTRAGVEVVDWAVSDTRPTVLTVVYDGSGGDGVPASEDEADELAEGIWTGVPVGFKRLSLQTTAGDETGSWTRDQLTELYGRRPPGLDRDYDRGMGADLAGVLLTPMLLGAAVATVIGAVLIWRWRHQDSRAAQPAPWPPPAQPALWSPPRPGDPGRVRPAWLP